MSKLWKCITLLSTFLWHYLTTKTWNVYEGREHRANFLFFQGSYRFSIQNSRLFPDFFQNNNLFFQTQGYQIADRKRPLKKKRRNKAFSQTCRRDWIRFDQHEKKFTSEGLLVRLSKKRKTFYHFFKTLPLFSRLFPGLENAGQISRLFQEFKTLYEPCRF